MTQDVVTVSPLMEVEEAARFLTERRITGAPVVGAKGELLGVVSQTDLVRFQGCDPRWADIPAEERGKTPVVSVMSGKPITCEEETPVEEVARIMLERRIHRLLVVKGEKLCGIITAMDVLRSIAKVQPADLAGLLLTKRA